MNQNDIQICQHIITALASQKYANSNYLFLAPVDLTQFPDYTSIVKRPMDIGTAGKHLKNGYYKSIQEFYNDTQLCFENAESYHKDKPENKFVIDFAMKMKKNLRREYKAANRKFNIAASGATGGSGNASSSSAAAAAASATADTTAISKPKKLSLSLNKKRKSNSKSPDESNVKPTERKKKRKSTSQIGGSGSSSVSSSGSGGTNATKSAQKFSLKLNKKSSAQPPSSSSSLSPTPSVAAAAAAAPISSSSNVTKTPKPKIRLRLKTSSAKSSASKAAATPKAQIMKASTTKPLTIKTTTTPKSTTTSQITMVTKGATTPKTTSHKLTIQKQSKTPKSSSSSSSIISSSTPKSTTTPKLTISKGTKASKGSTSKITLTKPTKTSTLKIAPKITLTKPTKTPTLKITPKITLTKPPKTPTLKITPKITLTKPPKTPTSKLTIQNPTKTPKLSISKLTIPKGTKASTPKATTPKTPIPKATTPKVTSSSMIETSTKTTTTNSNNSNNTSTTTSESKSKSSKPTSTPRSAPSGPSRGKELPSAIAAKKANAKKETAAKANAKKDATSNTKKDSTTTSSASTSKASAKKELKKPNRSPKVKFGTITPKYKAQCSKVLSALKQREDEAKWFIKPVHTFKWLKLDDYAAKVPNPMDIGTMSNKLDKNSYASVADYVHDLRRIFANCLRYNSASAGDSTRIIARDMLISSERFLQLFIKNTESLKPLYPKLLYCWDECLKILDTILDLKDPDDKKNTVYNFSFPYYFYFGGKASPAWQEYKDKIKFPMDFGTITSNLFEATYQSAEAFVRDCRLVTSNCKAFYQGKDDGAIFIAQASRLEDVLSPRLDALLQYDRSEKGMDARKIANSFAVVKLLKPPKAFYTSMLVDLRDTTYTDKYTKMIERASLQFEDPVDTNLFKDYHQIIDSPMNLKFVENRISAGKYDYPEDFECDVNLIFKNCEAYNIPKKNDHIVNLAKHCSKFFRKMYTSRIKAFEASCGKKLFGDDKKDKKRPPSEPSVGLSAAPPAKRSKIDSTTAKRKSPVPQVQTNQQTPARGKSPKAPGKTQGKKTLPRIVIRTDGPLHHHEAIAKIKESFTCRRQHKELQLWEGACSRFFRELKRHPWVSTSKRFVFDAPVHMLHPEIKEAYTMQIKSPMDLTTAEGNLLQGGIYTGPQEFVHDVALVFANAVTFNKSGYELGDPTSMAYFDASKHLLRYTRWLSLEHLSAHLENDSQNEGMRQSGALPHWKLTESNQKDARYEMENIVFKQAIDKSEEGDKFTWYEVECEKLLKSLRRPADYKRMCYFLKPDFPADYVMHIPNPIEWESCDRKLKQRKYDTFEDIISDLRLIFTNAKKYNGRMKDIDTTSKTAYESAICMSEKLEAAIRRLYITAADRIEREKVDEIIFDREDEVKQKAEEAMMRTEMQKEIERSRSSGGESSRNTSTQHVKIIQRRPARRDLDFDNLLNDQDTASYEQSEMEAHNKRKIMHEEQQCDRVKMHRVTKNVARRVNHNLFWRNSAMYWAREVSETITQNHNLSLTANTNLVAGNNQKEKLVDNSNRESTRQASLVKSLLGHSDRSQVKLQLTKTKTKKKNKKRKRLFLD